MGGVILEHRVTSEWTGSMQVEESEQWKKSVSGPGKEASLSCTSISKRE